MVFVIFLKDIAKQPIIIFHLIILKNQQNILSTWTKIICMAMFFKMSSKVDSLKDFILEVHLDYSKELHALHNDCPLAPDKS